MEIAEQGRALALVNGEVALEKDAHLALPNPVGTAETKLVRVIASGELVQMKEFVRLGKPRLRLAEIVGHNREPVILPVCGDHGVLA